jgi:hypothetical protein
VESGEEKVKLMFVYFHLRMNYIKYYKVIRKFLFCEKRAYNTCICNYRLYPTKVNFKLKEAALHEREERGEVVQNQAEKIRGTFKKENLRKNRKRKRNKLFNNYDNKKAENVTIYRGLVPFAGTGKV